MYYFLRGNVISMHSGNDFSKDLITPPEDGSVPGFI